MASNFGNFAKAVGADVKAIKADVANRVTREQVTQQIVDATRDIASSETLNTIQAKVDAIDAVDLLAEYNKAKQ